MSWEDSKSERCVSYSPESEMGGTLGKEVYGQKFVERLSALGAAKGNPNVNFSDKPFFFLVLQIDSIKYN